MNDYVIVTDSCIDLSKDLANAMNLQVIPLSVKVEDKEYFNYLDEREITFKEFYAKLRSHAKTSTSQINANRFVEFMTPLLDEGKDIIYIAFSSALSGTYNSSLIAKEELQDKYPNQKIIIVDSLSASAGQGLLVTYAWNLKQQGKTIEEVTDWLEKNKRNFCHLFTVTDLDHLRRGGRLSSTMAILGTILHIKPILHVSLEGKLVATGKTRGRLSSLDSLVETMVKTITNLEGQTVYISHGDSLEDAKYVKNKIMEKLPITDIKISFIGPVIGSHSGDGTIALFYVGNDRFINDKA